MPLSRTILLLLALGSLQGRGISEPEAHFQSKVKPLLESRCISCHGTEKQKGSLRLDSREAAIKGGTAGPALVPGKPADSLIVKAVLHALPDIEMPPKEKLTPADIAVLEKWIKEGAPWPAAPAIASQPIPEGELIGDAWSDARNPIVRIFGGQRLDLWSLRPIKSHFIPAVKLRSWPRNPIDHFVLARMEEHNLRPVLEANRRALARRLHFDLTGLPPTPEDLEVFLNDKSPAAYEHLVEKLLASTAYAEHWARQWLDVVRYSDSNGFDWDEYRPRAWRFRDYVIRSFAADKPFDQFIREQLAGDELLEGPPTTPAQQDYLIATGYLRLGPHDNSAPLFNEQARSRAELMADLTETTASAFLGMTMSCCRCHDHKFDPLSQADHFRLRAFFEGVKFADDVPIDLAAEQESIKQHNAKLDNEIRPLKDRRKELLAPTKEKLLSERRAKLTDAEKNLLAIEKDKRTKEQRKEAESLEKKLEPSEKDIIAALDKPVKSDFDTLNKEIAALEKQRKSLTYGMLMSENGTNIPPTKIHFQGDYKAEREAVPPGYISILDPNPAKLTKPINPRTSGRRLTLANWITTNQNPLTARVLVNRVWMGHFGQGIVSTPNDFGFSGGKPTHPDLLDWLSSELMRNNWSLKHLHRLIVLSSTYRQDSKGPSQEIDAENRLLARQNLRRLSAEQLRDSFLAVSALLTAKNSGAPIWPEIAPEILQANPAFLDDNAEKTKGWYPSPVADRTARSLYLIQKRTVRIPFMETFDLPNNDVSCPRRSDSIVPTQSFTLLNGDEPVQAAKALAERVTKARPTNPREQIQLAFAYAFQRKPAPHESSACLEFLQKRSFPELCRALLNANEFIYLD